MREALLPYSTSEPSPKFWWGQATWARRAPFCSTHFTLWPISELIFFTFPDFLTGGWWLKGGGGKGTKCLFVLPNCLVFVCTSVWVRGNVDLDSQFSYSYIIHAIFFLFFVPFAFSSLALYNLTWPEISPQWGGFSVLEGGFGYFAWIKLDITSEIDSEIFEASIDTLLMMISGVAPGSGRVRIRTEHKDQASRRKLCRVICHSSFPFSFPVCH